MTARSISMLLQCTDLSSQNLSGTITCHVSDTERTEASHAAQFSRKSSLGSCAESAGRDQQTE